MSRLSPRRPNRRYQKLLRRGGIALAVSLCIAGALGWFALSGTARAVAVALDHEITALGVAAGLRVESLTLSGRHHASIAEIRSAAGIKPGVPIWTISPDALRSRVEALPWVARATVQRRLPDRLHIAVIERRPAALWQHDGRLRLIDREGAILSETGLGRFAHLPIVVGAAAYTLPADRVGADRLCPGRLDNKTVRCIGAPDFTGMLALIRETPTVNSRLHALRRIGQRRWDLHLTDGTVIKLPARREADALSRLASIERSEGLLDRAVTMVDLRVADRLIVKPQAAATTAQIIQPIREEEI